MPSPLQQALRNLGERIDEDLVGALYQRASLATSEIKQELTRLDLPFEDLQAALSPTRGQLQEASETVIRRARRRASVRGAMTGAVGLLAIPPETLAAMVQLLHLSQRLAVIWGHDPNTDRGQVILTRSFASAFELELPEQGQLGVRVRDLGRLAGRQLPDPRQTSLLIGLSLARHSLGRLGSRFARAVPGVGAIAGGIEARRTLVLASRRMAEVYSRAWRGGNLLEGPVEEAIELKGPGLATSTSPS